jgi:magnesium transporter
VLRSFAIESGRLQPLAWDGNALPAEAAWIDLATPTPEEEQLVEASLRVEIPTRAEAGGIQSSDRLVNADGTLYTSALVPAGPHVHVTQQTMPVTFVRTGRTLFTVRYSGADALDPFIERYASGEATLGDAGDLFAGLLEIAVDLIAERLEEIGESLDHLSQGIFHHPAAVARRAGRRLPIGKRTHRLEVVIEDLGTQHEFASKLRESVQSLIRLTTFSIEHADDGLRRRLQAVDADLRSVAEHNTALAGNMEFMLDATVGLIDIQQNKVIYILSIVSVVLTPPVVVASVYGMNFELIPELDWAYGYPWALGLMLLSAVGPFLFFKLRGWL